MSSVRRICSSLVTPLLNKRQYRVIRLPNGLEALLIHDLETDKASASMDVSVGNYNDPEDIQGLAHCLEHALFMGTEKYPEENEYRRYLAANAGHSNAWTNQCNTNYHFEVAATSSEGNTSQLDEKEVENQPQEDIRARTDEANDSLSVISSGDSLSGSSSTTETDDCDCHPSSKPKDSDPYPASPLYGALDRFAQFFICPLFLSSSLSRELHAVDSENKKNFQNDAWRLRQLSKSLSNPLHPYHKFICGNLETLKEGPARMGKDIREEFIKFYKREYSANKMKLVVLGRENLDVLENWVEDLFSAISTPSSSPPTKCHTETCEGFEGKNLLSYPASHLTKLISVVPIMARRELHIRFSYQDEDNLHQSQPGRYLMHLIGHEGPGSILCYLKARNWANSLYAGPHPEGPDNAFFMIYIHLTDTGLSQYEDVVKAVFRYLSLLRHDGVQFWIWEEMKAMADVEFKWKAKAQNAMMFVTGLANKMQKPLERSQLLSGYEVLGKYDHMALNNAVDLLTPERCNLTILSKDVVENKKANGLKLQKEKWYGTEYVLEELPPQLLSEMKRVYYQNAAEKGDGELHLPNPNPFIPTHLTINRPSFDGVPARRPDLLADDEQIRLWHKEDDTFFVPKVTINLLVRSPLLDPSTVTLPNSVAVEVYCKLISDTLTEFYYDACLTGYTYSLTPANRRGGIQISVKGYSDKIYTLLRKILVTLKTLDVSKEQFERVKEDVVIEFKDHSFKEPFRQAGDILEYLVCGHGWTNQQKLSVLEETFVLDDITAFKQEFLRQGLHLEGLVHGNVSADEALRIGQDITSIFDTAPGTLTLNSRDVLYPPGSFTYHHSLADPANVNNCIEYALQLNSDVSVLASRVKAFLLETIIEEPAFDTLRTQEQLGYIVFSGVKLFARAMWMFIRIQSERECTFLEGRIEEFLKGFLGRIKLMSTQEFDKYKSSLELKLKKKWENLTAESNWYWERCVDGYNDFERKDEDAQMLRGMDKNDMVRFCEDVIGTFNGKRTKLAVHLDRQGTESSTCAKANGGHTDDNMKITNVQEFKTALWLTPAPQSAWTIKNVSALTGGSQTTVGRQGKRRLPSSDDEKQVRHKRRCPSTAGDIHKL